MSAKIFYDIMPPNPRSLLMFLKASKIPFTPCPIAMRKNEHRTEEYAANIHPFNKLPAMRDGDFKLTESVSIAKYLIEKHGCDDHWYPKNLQRKAKVNEYLDWQQSGIMVWCTKVFLLDAVFPLMTGTPPNPDDIEPDAQNMETSLEGFQSYFLGGTPFICGDEISLADIFGVNAIVQLECTSYSQSLESRPILKAYIQRVRERVSPSIFDECCMMLHKLQKGKAQPKL